MRHLAWIDAPLASTITPIGRGIAQAVTPSG